MNIPARAKATQGVIDKHRDKAFDWAGANCIRLARAQGKALGHSLPPVPLFKTPTGALRALRKQDCASVTDLLDRYFVRLPAPSYAVVGDLVSLPAEGPLEAICIADGLGNLIGWHDSDLSRLSNIKFAAGDAQAAWRVGV